MIKFKPYAGDPFSLYKAAVKRSHGSKKSTLTSIEGGMGALYDEYNRHFTAENVHTLPKHKLPATHTGYLRSLYSSTAAVTTTLKEDFKSRLASRVHWGKCPYCMYESADTMEHILPKEDFPEYAIHALNLIPCCTLCNSHKGVKVKDGVGDPEFLNFYYHEPDTAEFLKLDITLDATGKPEFHYSLCFPPGTDALLQRIVTNHYANLNLIERLDDEVISKYTSEEVKIMATLRTNSVEYTMKTIGEWVTEYTPLYGKNHYYTVLLRLLATSPVYKGYLNAIKMSLK